MPQPEKWEEEIRDNTDQFLNHIGWETTELDEEQLIKFIRKTLEDYKKELVEDIEQLERDEEAVNKTAQEPSKYLNIINLIKRE